MIKNIGIEHIQSHRLLVSNKMNLVAFIGKSLTQFCGQHTTSTKGGITNNPYSHNSWFGVWRLGFGVDHPFFNEHQTPNAKPQTNFYRK